MLDSTTTPPVAYEIASWGETFETSDSRKHKTLAWISLPTDRQSSGYQSLIDHFGDESPAIYGAWCALVSIAAACPKRGTLTSGKGEPYSVQRIARMAFMPQAVFVKLFEWASKPNVGWLIACEARQDDPVIDCQSINDQSVIDCPSIATQSTIELPNTTLPNTTLPTHTPSFDGDECESQDRQSGINQEDRPETAPRRKPPSSKKNPRGYTDDFERWWKVYPRKAEKPKAFVAFIEAIKRIGRDHLDDDPLKWLIARTKLYADSVTGKDNRYTKHPAPWLNADGFNDEPPPPKSSIGPGQRYDPACKTFGEGFG